MFRFQLMVGRSLSKSCHRGLSFYLPAALALYTVAYAHYAFGRQLHNNHNICVFTSAQSIFLVSLVCVSMSGLDLVDGGFRPSLSKRGIEQGYLHGRNSAAQWHSFFGTTPADERCPRSSSYGLGRFLTATRGCRARSPTSSSSRMMCKSESS
jgi:hypothetical protein